jgi:hypothetical protein
MTILASAVINSLVDPFGKLSLFPVELGSFVTTLTAPACHVREHQMTVVRGSGVHQQSVERCNANGAVFSTRTLQRRSSIVDASATGISKLGAQVSNEL